MILLVKIPKRTPFLRMTSNLIVLDDFYTNVDQVRKLALSVPYEVKGNYPGQRSDPHIAPGVKPMFEKLLGLPITYWPEDKYNGAFQYATAKEDSWVHRDATDWAAIIYLTPDAPVSSGTAFYRHVDTGLDLIPEGVQPGIQAQMDRDSQRMDKWTEVDRVGNIYNRCVIFNGRRSHRSCDYFGDSLENGRLFQLFFFNTQTQHASLT